MKRDDCQTWGAQRTVVEGSLAVAIDVFLHEGKNTGWHHFARFSRQLALYDGSVFAIWENPLAQKS